MLSYDSCLKYAQENHYCPHCKERLSCCETPPFHIGDGLGWGCEVMFVCLNDNCPVYARGWKHIEDQYGHSGSYRYMLLPGEEKGGTLMVGSPEAFTGCVIDPEVVKKQNVRYQEEKEALHGLDACIKEHNLQPALKLILDEAAGLEGRIRSCDCLVDLNDLACIDPIRNHTFTNPDIEHRANISIQRVLQGNFKKECPYCAEIIKNQAKMCMHCGKEIS
ncbi:MAG: zinc ribbon domain-containing protein [Deltaproteobacteria bacterium]|nr:zinc ribbon domain-containing protein [Deltaproteobacteria bacterium]